MRQQEPLSKEKLDEIVENGYLSDSGLDKEIFSVLYNELHTIAKGMPRINKINYDVQTTALLHEAFIHFMKKNDFHWKNLSQFYAVAAKTMRQILIDQARKVTAAKRGGKHTVISYEDLSSISENLALQQLPIDQFDSLDLAIKKLEEDANNKRLVQIVELRFFMGLTIEETAEILKVSRSTVFHDWMFTKAWLARELKKMQI